jgi:hypothetical protein
MMARGIILALVAALIVEVLFCRWLARRKWRPGTTRIAIAAGIAALIGPACAALPYTDYLPAALLGNHYPSGEMLVFVLAAIGAIGIAIGVFAFCKGSKIAGAICVLTNIPVFACYGFIASQMG